MRRLPTTVLWPGIDHLKIIRLSHREGQAVKVEAVSIDHFLTEWRAPALETPAGILGSRRVRFLTATRRDSTLPHSAFPGINGGYSDHPRTRLRAGNLRALEVSKQSFWDDIREGYGKKNRRQINVKFPVP